jgi:hypothetical protein
MSLKKALQPLSYDLSGLAFPALSKTWLLQRQYHWQLFMPHLINGVFGPFVSQFCQEIKFGDYSMSRLSDLRQGAFQRFYAGLQEIDNATFTFITSVDNAVLDYFHGWYHLVVDEEGYYNPKSVYKKHIHVAMYDRTGVESIRFTLKGVFPKIKPVLALSYSGDDVFRFDVVLSVDSVEMFSLIGSVRGAITNTAGNIYSATKEMLGGVGGLGADGLVTKAGNILFG